MRKCNTFGFAAVIDGDIVDKWKGGETRKLAKRNAVGITIDETRKKRGAEENIWHENAEIGQGVVVRKDNEPGDVKNIPNEHGDVPKKHGSVNALVDAIIGRENEGSHVCVNILIYIESVLTYCDFF